MAGVSGVALTVGRAGVVEPCCIVSPVVACIPLPGVVLPGSVVLTDAPPVMPDPNEPVPVAGTLTVLLPVGVVPGGV